MRLLPAAEPPSRGALAAYFEATAAECLRHLGRRPLTLVRHVEGITFFHKGPLPPVPDAVRQIDIIKGDGTTGVRLFVDDPAGLLGLVEIGAVEIHPWGSTVDHLERPDRLIFDLDPDEGVAWEAVVAAAFALRAFLEARGIESWPKTTGGKGLHLVVPVEPKKTFKEIGPSVKEIAQTFAATDAERYTATAGAKARAGGKIFVDWLRNGRGASAIGAMSPRARLGGLVAMPLRWDELEEGVTPETFTLEFVLAQDRLTSA